MSWYIEQWIVCIDNKTLFQYHKRVKATSFLSVLSSWIQYLFSEKPLQPLDLSIHPYIHPFFSITFFSLRWLVVLREILSACLWIPTSFYLFPSISRIACCLYRYIYTYIYNTHIHLGSRGRSKEYIVPSPCHQGPSSSSLLASLFSCLLRASRKAVAPPPSKPKLYNLSNKMRCLAVLSISLYFI